ncbi:sulfatase-like hydrolase/transferase [Reyranella sp.]|uniref:sulfatase-like hydrolase/transferase n=1 Tax=Reyranella sp. TaxID=1929291 RepID=UPI003D0CA50D
MLITFSKIAASAVLLLATVGLLWHKNNDAALWPAASPIDPVLPEWLTSAAYGWYPTILGTLENLLQRKSTLASIAYLFVCGLCVASVFAAPFISNPLFRYLISVILLGGVSYDLVMFDIGGHFPSLETTNTILSNIRFGLDGTVGSYADKILRNLCFALLVLFVFFLQPPLLARWVPTVCVGMAGLGIAIILWRTDGYTRAFPSPVSSFINVYKSRLANEDQPIAEVIYAAVPASHLRKIILVMDESVRGDYISLNNKLVNTTPFLASGHNELINFGIATSATNCSTESRLAVRFGTRESDLGESWKTLRSRTSIWQYAKYAGFKTVHIDTFGTISTLLNGMTATERSFIDERIIVEDMPVYLRDEVAASKLRGLLQDPTPMFIFLDKYGTHLPYNRMYPPSRNVFEASQSPFSLKNQSELIRHYKNAVMWSVDGFFEILLRGGLPSDTLLFYTSDHGQSLSETPTMISHCSESASVVKTEVIVPLFALTNNMEWKTALSVGAASNFGFTSHFQLFPTILLAMGYEREQLSGKLDLSLLDSQTFGRRRQFRAGRDLRIYDDH